MTKEQALFFLNRFRDERKPVDHEAEAQAGTSYGARARKVEAAEAAPTQEQQALEVAINAISALPVDFKLPTGDRLFQ